MGVIVAPVLHLTSAEKFICRHYDKSFLVMLQLQECPIVHAEGFVALELILVFTMKTTWFSRGK